MSLTQNLLESPVASFPAGSFSPDPSPPSRIPPQLALSFLQALLFSSIPLLSSTGPCLVLPPPGSPPGLPTACRPFFPSGFACQLSVILRKNHAIPVYLLFPLPADSLLTEPPGKLVYTYNLHSHTYLHVYMHTCMCLLLHSDMCAPMSTHVCTHTHTHTHTHTLVLPAH